MRLKTLRYRFSTFLIAGMLGTLSAANAASPDGSGSAKTADAPRAHTASIDTLHVSGKSSKRARSDGPGIRSSAALVMDMSDSSILYSRQPDIVAPIASISKLMTALVVLDADQPADEILQVDHEDRTFNKGVFSRIQAGSKLTRDDLLHVALMASDNLAAHVVARNYPGGMTEMVKAMNAKATELGMTHSHFVEPTGLSAENVASPEDLIKMVDAASKNPTIRKFSTDESYTLVAGRRMIEFRNTNSLVRNTDWDILVQKTGYTSQAGRCLVMKTVIQGRPLVIVLLDSFGKNTRVADARRIRKWIEAQIVPATQTASNLRE
jgi:serine-type D-Ala-D-Ala endopeptidase (penicillin-binding protein 7)